MDNITFVGLDVHNESITAAILEDGADELLHEHHFPGLHELSGDEPIEVHPARHLLRIPGDGLLPRLDFAVDEGRDQALEELIVKHPDFDAPDLVIKHGLCTGRGCG